MRSPVLLPLLRSQTQGDLLALLFLHPEQEFSLTDAARAINASVPGVHHEAARLVQGGLLTDRRSGNSRMIRADTSTILTGPLTDLLAVTYGPRPVLTDALRTVPGIDRAFIYGSWAARYRGEPGPVPLDVDVLVIGTADPDDLDDAAQSAGRVLRREVSVRRVSAQAWERAEAGVGDSPFLTTVASRALVELDVQPTRTAAPA